MDIRGDFTTSVKKALKEINPKYERLPGLVICGSHTPKNHDIDELLELIKGARESGIPFLGICFGHQLAAVEYARNVMNIENAVSEEWGKGFPVVKKREEGLKVGMGEDGETYWNNYEVILTSREWKKPKGFFTVQYHPEYSSMPGKPHPVLTKFLDYAENY